MTNLEIIESLKSIKSTCNDNFTLTVDNTIAFVERSMRAEEALIKIEELIKSNAPRPHFINQQHFEEVLKYETVIQAKSEFLLDEWVIGHIMEVIADYRKKDDR